MSHNRRAQRTPMQRGVAEALAHNSDVQPAQRRGHQPATHPAATPRGTSQPSRVAKRFIASVGCTMRSCRAKRFDTTATRRRPARPRHPAAAGKAATRRGRDASPQPSRVVATRRRDGAASQPRGARASCVAARQQRKQDRGGRGAHGPGGARAGTGGGVGSGSSKPPESSLIPPFPAFRALRGGPPCVCSERGAPADCSREQGHPPRKSGKGGISEGCGGRAHGSPPSRLRFLSVLSLRVVVALSLCHPPLRVLAPTQASCQAAHSRHASRAMLPCKRNTCVCRVSVVK